MALQQDERSQRLARRPCGRSISASRSSLYHKGSLCKFVLSLHIRLPIMYLYSLSTDLISGGGGALCLRSFQACFPHPNLPPLFPIFHTGKQNFAKSPGEKNISNIKVSYYDKLLDACEHVAVKRGRAPLIREVFSH